MKITIEAVSNGYIAVTEVEGETPTTEVFGDSIDNVTELLFSVMENLGHCGSRYDAKRIYITVGPGDKHEDYSDNPGEDEL